MQWKTAYLTQGSISHICMDWFYQKMDMQRMYSTTLWDLNKMRRRQVTNDCGGFCLKICFNIHLMINGRHQQMQIYVGEYESWPKIATKIVR